MATKKLKGISRVVCEIYKRSDKFNFRIITYSNLGVDIICSSRQGYSRLIDCMDTCSDFTYKGVKVEVERISKYYRIK